MLYPINSYRNSNAVRRLPLTLLVIGLVAGLGISRSAFAQDPGQKTFSSTDAAAEALVAAARDNNDQEMLTILGPSAHDVVSSGDPVADKANRAEFVAKYRQLHQFAAASDGRTFLYIGGDNWPTPIPLRKGAAGWYFDTAYGKQEILYRRIGFDELKVVRVCKAIVAAEKDYFAKTHDGGSVHQYSQKFSSTPGSQDGLYWEVKAGQQPQSPLGPLVAEASSEGYSHGTAYPHRPFHGYVYRLLPRQGADAQGGAKDYTVNGQMTGGFAVVAYPAKYRDTGVMTFVVNQDGQVYQKDLGPNTEQIASTMTDYNPDKTWSAVAETEADSN